MAKRKRTPLEIAKDKAWKACSRYVRLRDADEDGNCTCVTCGKVMPWQKAQAGHFVPGRFNAILFDTRGIHAQCYGCNVRKCGNLIFYWPWMEEHMGRDVIDDLCSKIGTSKDHNLEDYLTIERIFKRKIDKLAEEKKIEI